MRENLKWTIAIAIPGLRSLNRTLDYNHFSEGSENCLKRPGTEKFQISEYNSYLPNCLFPNDDCLKKELDWNAG